MSFTDDYNAQKQKRKKKEKEQVAASSKTNFEKQYYTAAVDRAPVVEDIAPVAVSKQILDERMQRRENEATATDIFGKDTKKAQEQRTVFKKSGVFEDGYDFGDITRTILGTAGDAVTGVAKGFVGSFEGITDLASYGVAKVADLAGEDEFAEDLKRVAQRSQTDKIFGGWEKASDKDSVLGDKADTFANVIGQVLSLFVGGAVGKGAGLGAKGVTAVTTGMTATSSMGSGMSEAYQGGATDGEATAYGAMVGATDAITELLAGGLGKAINAVGISRGIGGLDDIFAKKVAGKVTSKIGNEFWKNTISNATEYGIKSAAEGAEEVLAGYGSAIAKKLTYMSDEELEQIVKDENILEQFVMGTLAGGVVSAPGVVSSTAAGTDYVTGYTQSEQNVIDAEVQKRIAEAENNGEKPNKSKIYDDVVRDMEKGYIDTDTIESVLGGEDYTNYQSELKRQEELDNELKEFRNMKSGDMTDIQAERMAELKAMKPNTEMVNTLKFNVDERVRTALGQNSRLNESYNERARRGQQYVADLSKYDDKQKAVIQKAIDSGILNNTNRTHEFVDMVAKISADKGVLFDFTNNAKLKESSFAVDGATVNGFVTKDGITVNIDSHKAVNSVVGHEITHVLEGTELYAEMQTALFEYAKSKGDYQGRHDTLSKLYANVEGADVDAELTADLVGDYLFTDSDFINSLSTEHRNVFQKIYDEIKYLCKIATAGSKQARELERVKRAFDAAYKESGKVSSDTKFSLSDNEGKQLTKEQGEYFKDSKMRDDNGNLKVMYHGSQDAGFHVFDPSMSDDGTSLFFVDRNDVATTYSGTSETYEAKAFRSAEDANKFFASIGKSEYEVIERDGEYTLYDDGDEVATSGDLSEIYDEWRDWEGVGYGDANYKVYLNLKNPLEVDAKGRPWNKIDAEFSQEVYDRYANLTDEEKAALHDLAEWEDFSLFNREIQEAKGDALASAYAKMGEDVNIYDLFSVAADNFSEDSMRENSRRYLKTRDFAQRAKEGGYDGVIFKNVIDNGGYSSGDEGASTVAIAFSSEQVKSVANEKPTKDPDIRYSLSEYTAEEKKAHNDAVLEHFGKTYKWAETGYLLLDGTRLDLSGKHDGAPGGYRTVDHRDITDALGYDYGGGDYSGSLIQFMSEGNIRIVPEIGGINLSVKPTKAQEQALSDFISRNRGEVVLDIDDLKGNTVVSVEYPKGTYYKKVLDDIREWFDNGKQPETSGVSMFRSLTKEGETPKRYGNYHVRGEDIKYNPAQGTIGETVSQTDTPTVSQTEDVAPVAEDVPETLEESTFPKWADNEIASYKNDIAEARAKAKPRKKPLFGALKRLVTTKPKGNESHHGVRTSDGKQYMSSNAFFVVEMNTPDKSIIENEALNVDGMKGVLERANSNAIEGNYKIDPIDITLIHKQVGNDNRSVVIVGENVYDIRFVDAVLQAIENPTVQLASSPVSGMNFLLVKGSNGQAAIAPINHKVNSKTNGEELRYVYRAEKVNVEQIAPVPETEQATPEGFAPTTEAEANAMSSEILDSLTDADAPPEIDAPYYGERENATPSNPFARRDYTKVGNPKTKSYISENPDALPFFREAATAMLGDLQNSQKGERWYNDRLYYESGGQEGIGGTRRETTADIADLLDGQYHYTYQQIEDALNAIINNKPLNACAKRIEFALNDRLLKGYTDIDGNDIPANQDYINLLNRQQTQEVYQNKAASEVFTDSDAPYVAETPQTEAPAPKVEKPIAQPAEDVAPAKDTETEEHIADIRRADPKAKDGSWLSRTKKSINDAITVFGDKGWALENLSKKTGNRELEAKYDIMKNRTKGMAQEYIKDNLLPIYERIRDGGKIEDFDRYSRHLLNIDRMSLDTDAAKARRAELKKSLDGYKERQIESMASETITRNTPQDRIALIFAAREYVDLGGAKGKNKPVYGNSVTADVSRKVVAEYEAANPEFKEYEQAVLEYNRQLRDMAVKHGIISGKTAELWAKMYPHYVPIRRTDKQGASVSVPLDANKTGVNNPFKRATGGNSDFEPLFETMASNTEQIIRAINRNRFGIELMETLQAANILDAKAAVDAKARKAINNGDLPAGTKVRAHDRENIGVIESFDSKTGKYSVYFKNKQGHTASVKLDANILTPLGVWNPSAIDGVEVDAHEVLESVDENDKAVLKEGKNGVSPSFAVFVNGKRVEFDITEEIYNALKPTNEFLAKTSKPVNALANAYKKLVTQYNPMFSFWRNPVKDTKDVLFNSQHAAKTYATAPKTIKEFATKGKYFEEFRKNGGMSGSYYDTQKKTFTKKPGIVRKVVGFPLDAYNNVSEKFEMFWRLSEYIASRESGRSVEVSMLDAMRVTTNFAAGGDFTKWANRNGALFLNPSVQGAMQIGRNVREAYHNGAKGMAILAAKVLATGMGGLFFNWLLWDDDEDYNELSDYAKQNYFIVAKTEDGQFIRIPKGRMEAVIQNGFEQMQNLITGDDDVDMQTFGELVVNNLAPNNPLENNLIAPIIQAKNNKTWYGEDLVPTRLQDLPAAEQYDESTDIFSKWLGEKLGNAGLDVSPYKINYVLDQYSGGAGDVFLPMLTPEAESDNNLLAPIKDEFTVDPVMKNQNVSDFYDKVDELKKNANSAYATDEDILSYKYMNSVNSELGELYAQKREIQNSDLSDKEKREAVRELQAQIDSIARESLGTYGNVNIDGGYANVGDIHYRVNKDGEWQKITDKQLEKQNAVTRGLGISASEYWSNKEEYDYAYDNPEKYTVAKAVGGYTAYRTYSSELYDIKGVDEDGDGRSDTGTRKANVLDYINNLDADYGEKIILFKSRYNADDTYNYDIIEYLNSRDDISYDEMVTILKELGFTVHSNGTVTW